jgi:hypothetical protein
MAAVHVKFECRECSFVTTDGVEAQEHSDAERHGLEVLGEIQPRVGSPLSRIAVPPRTPSTLTVGKNKQGSAEFAFPSARRPVSLIFSTHASSSHRRRFRRLAASGRLQVLPSRPS